MVRLAMHFFLFVFKRMRFKRFFLFFFALTAQDAKRIYGIRKTAGKNILVDQIVMLRCNKIVELLKPAFKRNRIASTKKNGFVEIVKIFIDDE